MCSLGVFLLRCPPMKRSVVIIVSGLVILFAVVNVVGISVPDSTREVNLVSNEPDLSVSSSTLPVAPSRESGGSSSERTDEAPLYKEAMTTWFFVGEPSDESNDFIPNHVSYWDEKWLEHFGGIDSPERRCGLGPCGFTPRENPFYFALPYGEFLPGTGDMKANAKLVPWYVEGSDKPLIKNRWIEVKHGENICYGQWEDVGPNGEDDFAYVFGEAEFPVNTFGVRAGLDVSPALWNCLGLLDNATTSWAFVESIMVPPGPWKETVTESGISWGE